MSWADYETPTLEIDLGKSGKGSVRGLNLDDFTLILTKHLDAALMIAETFNAGKANVSSAQNYTDVAILVGQSFPGFLSEVISIAADEPSIRGKKLTAGIQIASIQAILKLTLEEAGGLGNLFATLAAAVKAVLEGKGEMSQRVVALLSNSSILDAVKTQTSSSRKGTSRRHATH